MSDQPAAAPPPRSTRVQARQERARLRRARQRRILLVGGVIVVVAAVVATLALVFTHRGSAGGPVADSSPIGSSVPPGSTPPSSGPTDSGPSSESPSGSASGSASPGTSSPTTPGSPSATAGVDASTMLRPGATTLLSGWRIAGTTTGQEAAAQSFLCQTQRYLDPAGTDTWVRRLTAPGGAGSLVQYTDASSSVATAQRSYATVRTWLAGCLDSRVQLLGSSLAAGVAEQAVVASFAAPASSTSIRVHTIAVVRSGRATIVLDRARLVATSGVAAAAQADATATAGLARTATALACRATGGRCPGSGSPTLTSTLLPSARAGFLNPVELPVVGASAQPWVGTAPTTLSAVIGSGCDRINPKSPATASAVSRDYLIPDPSSPATLGFTTDVLTYASGGTPDALLTQVRSSVAACTKRIATAKVETTSTIAATGAPATVTGTAWRMTYDIGGGKTATYRIGVAAAGSRLVHVSYLVSPGYDITDAQFAAVVVLTARRAAAGLRSG